MTNDGGASRRKTEISVTISLAHDELFSGAVFLNDGERLIDLLNDARAFIPVRRDDGATVIVAKSNIVSIIERASRNDESSADKLDESDGKDHAGEAGRPRRAPFDPYKVLRISADATIDEVRRAYKARMKAVHPDTLAGLDLDDEIQKAAMTAAQRVNVAYNRILRERRSGESDIAGESAA
jgi:hypothetical protein